MIDLKGIAGRSLAILLAMAAVAAAGAAQAEPLRLKPGPTALPTSGLLIDIPARPDITFTLTGGWSIDTARNTFESRDVVDELRTQTDTLVAGNWVMTGFFDAGDCRKILAMQSMDNPWAQDAQLWGADWKARGGVYDLGGSIGRVPTVMLCRTDLYGRSLLLYRYLIDQPLTLDQRSMMKLVEAADVLQQAWKSYRDMRTADVLTTRRPEINRRGDGMAQRRVNLNIARLSLQLPDDGYVWLEREGDNFDMIDRLAPSLPDVSLEVALGTQVTCQDMFSALKDQQRPNHKPAAAPPGWLIGESVMIDGETERVICRETSLGALMVGIIQGPKRTDITPLYPILNALALSSKVP